MQELKINSEFENLLPPPTEDELAGLEADVVANVCRDAILVWNNVVVDGHSRLRICRKHNVDYATFEMNFPSENAAKVWIWKNQGNRRNLTPIAKIELAVKMKPILESEAKERMRQGGGDRKSDAYKREKSGKEILPESISGRQVRDELAEQAEVSGGAFDKGVYVLEHADDETEEKLRRGDKGVSISGVYTKLKEGNSAIREVPSDEQTVVEPYVAASENAESSPPPAPRWEPSVTLNKISCVDPDPLVGAIFELFPEEYRSKFFSAFFDRFLYWQGKDETEKLFIQLAQTLNADKNER